MIRQNKDERPIYSDKIWHQIIETGKKLEKLGYKESYNKPNLFYKYIRKSSEKDELGNKQGIFFADLRGTDIVPIWDEPKPITYSKDLPFEKYIVEFILLIRAGCSPRLTFFQSMEPSGWAFGLYEMPSGYCKRCGSDIIYSVKWDILEEDINDLFSKGIDPNIEINYCNICREIEYAKREYRLKYLSNSKFCELCGIKEAELDHHITYNPSKIIRLCRSCHGKLHKKDFTNPIWKEKNNKSQNSEAY